MNFNIGVLGHVDSGKTSLVKALSTTASTACFDKNPQSKERGITLDLGFSSFTVPMPDQSKLNDQDAEIQVTLVDCPGHASLIRTIIGGSQIIDLMMLVIDITKGIQTQTAECLIIGEILCDRMIVCLNKVDLLPENRRNATIEKMTKRLSKTFESTRFKQAPIVPVAACPGADPDAPFQSVGIDSLISQIQASSYHPERDYSGRFLFSVDHCFSIRGQGTVMTGTILRGSVKVNDDVEIPQFKLTKKVKSMQMFKKPVQSATHGDRLGICVTQFDPKLFERGYVCAPGSLKQIHAGLTMLNSISHYKQAIRSKQKYHITIGHDTVMATILLFAPLTEFESSQPLTFRQDEVYLHVEEMTPELSDRGVFCLLQFERSITCPADSLFIASKLELDVNTPSCRIAFHGKLFQSYFHPDYVKTVLPTLKICKLKEKRGQVERMVDAYSLIGKNLFKKETNIERFIGLKVTLSSGEKGYIEGSFGSSGKYKIRLDDGLQAETKLQLTSTDRKKKKNVAADEPQRAAGDHQSPIEIILQFKRFVYDEKKLMVQ